MDDKVDPVQFQGSETIVQKRSQGIFAHALSALRFFTDKNGEAGVAVPSADGVNTDIPDMHIFIFMKDGEYLFILRAD